MSWGLVNLGHSVILQDEYSEARAILSQSLQIFQETGVATGTGMGIIFTIEGFASLAVRQKEAERATRLYAWTDTARAAWQSVRPRAEQKDVEQDIPPFGR